MELWNLIYKIEGELPGGPARCSSVKVMIVTDDGRQYEPEQASCDGELLIINARAVDRQ